jgi:hypothetical protein
MDYPGQYLTEEEENQLFQNKNKKILEDVSSLDKGYNKVMRSVVKSDGRKKQVKVDVYTSGCIGSNIRDAENGQYYAHKVGSLNEELYFKVALATGECTSKNGSSTLFYMSPQHYMSHQSCDVSPDIISKWEERRNLRINMNNKNNKQGFAVIVN